MEQSGNQEIKCTVAECRYNDNVSNCTLHDIVVGSTESVADCLSFEEE